MPKRNLIWLILMLLVAAAAVWLARLRPLMVLQVNQTSAGPFEPLLHLNEIAQQHYVDEVPPQTVAGAIRGYLRELDPYCRYVLPDQPDYLDRIIRGRRCDLGIRYQLTGGLAVILGVMPKSPALSAGLRGGDVLMAVGATPVNGLDRAAIDALLTGEAAEPIEFVIRRQDRKFPVEIAPADYDLETVTGICRRADGEWEYMLDAKKKIGYIRISEFATGTADAFNTAVRELLQRGLKGLVLDLRDNPGGPLEEAVAVADSFLTEGIIVVTRGRDDHQERYVAHPDRSVPVDLPVVVLVNNHTVSATEVLAGALKRHRRALLLGTATFGKNVVQQPFSLGPGMGTVVLTTSRYYFEEPAATEPATREAASRPALQTARIAKVPAAATRGSTRAGHPASPTADEAAGIAPHVLEENDEAAQRERQAFWYSMEVVKYPPAPASGPATSRPCVEIPDWALERVEELRQADKQLNHAVQLVEKPAAINALLSLD